jgi:hypothetical protein
VHVEQPVGTTGEEVARIVWTLNDPADGVNSYRIYRHQASGGLIGAVNAQTNGMDIQQSAMRGGRTTFYVTAVNIKGESVASDRTTIQR